MTARVLREEPAAPELQVVPAGLVDVARVAGVSIATASRALNHNHTHPVNARTRQKVEEAAAKLDYHVNPSGRSLRVGRLATMAVLVHDIADPYFAEVVRAVTAAAWDAGMLTMVCSSNRDPQIEMRYVEMLSRSRVAAVLFAGGGLEDPDYQRVVAAQGEVIAGYGGAVVALAPRAEPWPCEVPDNRAGAAAAARYILGLGHRQIAVITGPERLRTSWEREAGFRDALDEAAMTPVMARGDFTPSGGSRAVAALVASGQPFTALLVSNDGMAIGALHELQRAGIKVPEEVSVIGFDDVPGLDYHTPALTTVRVPLQEIGVAAVARALAILRGEDAGLPRVRVHPFSIVERASTGRPGGGRA